MADYCAIGGRNRHRRLPALRPVAAAPLTGHEPHVAALGCHVGIGKGYAAGAVVGIIANHQEIIDEQHRCAVKHRNIIITAAHAVLRDLHGDQTKTRLGGKLIFNRDRGPHIILLEPGNPQPRIQIRRSPHIPRNLRNDRRVALGIDGCHERRFAGPTVLPGDFNGSFRPNIAGSSRYIQTQAEICADLQRRIGVGQPQFDLPGFTQLGHLGTPGDHLTVALPADKIALQLPRLLFIYFHRFEATQRRSHL